MGTPHLSLEVGRSLVEREELTVYKKIREQLLFKTVVPSGDFILYRSRKVSRKGQRKLLFPCRFL